MLQELALQPAHFIGCKSAKGGLLACGVGDCLMDGQVALLG